MYVQQRRTMDKKRIVIALGHNALGTTLPEQKKAAEGSARAVAEFIAQGYQVVVTHSNGPQVGMIHTAMNEFSQKYPEYTDTPMSVCSAMSQGYIGYDLQSAIRSAIINKGIYKTVATVLTQVTVDPYDEAFYRPTKIIGRVLNEEEAKAQEKKGNHVTPVEGGYRRIVAAPKPQSIVEINAINALLDADQVVIACGGGGIPVLSQDNRLQGASAVIEKDLAAGKLAELLDADMLVLFNLDNEFDKVTDDQPFVAYSHELNSHGNGSLTGEMFICKPNPDFYNKIKEISILKGHENDEDTL